MHYFLQAISQNPKIKSVYIKAFCLILPSKMHIFCKGLFYKRRNGPLTTTSLSRFYPKKGRFIPLSGGFSAYRKSGRERWTFLFSQNQKKKKKKHTFYRWFFSLPFKVTETGVIFDEVRQSAFQHFKKSTPLCHFKGVA